MEVFYSTATVTGSPVQVPPPAVQGTGLSGLGAWSGDVPFLDVAEFRGLPQDPELPSLYATIDWGDGTGAQQNLVFVTFKDGAYVVSGSHEYRATTPSGSQTSIGGTFPIKVTLYFNDHDDATKNTLLATAQTSIDVMPNSPGGLTLNLAAGAPFSGVLGTFMADAGRSVNAGFIDWGDGSTQGTDATLTPLGNNVYQVSGSHTYAAPGRYRISLQLDYGTPEQFDTTVFDALVSTASIT